MSILHWNGAEFHSCGYCKTTKGSISNGLWAQTLTVDDYQAMLNRGWRRCGKYCYKPIMDKTCCPQYTIRCKALEFRATKSQRKVIKKFNKFQRDGVMPEKTTICHSPSAAANSDEDSSDEVDGIPTVPNPSTTIAIQCPAMAVDCASSSAKPRKEVRKGLGADATKPRCKKAKVLRMERKQMSVSKTKSGECEKSFVDLLEEPSSDSAMLRNMLKIKLIRPLDKDVWEGVKQQEFEVYIKYQVRIHHDAPGKCTMSSFERFLVDSPLQSSDPSMGSFHQQYWLNERLVAVGVIDILPQCVSSVYLFYDPDFHHLTLGEYSALREIAFTRHLHAAYPNIQYYYMGYYIHTCAKMRYKARLRPSDLLCPETYRWTNVADAIAILDRSKYARLYADANVDDEDACSDQQMQLLKIINNHGCQLLHQYAHRRKHNKTLQTLRAILGASLIQSVYIVDFQA